MEQDGFDWLRIQCKQEIWLGLSEEASVEQGQPAKQAGNSSYVKNTLNLLTLLGFL